MLNSTLMRMTHVDIKYHPHSQLAQSIWTCIIWRGRI